MVILAGVAGRIGADPSGTVEDARWATQLWGAIEAQRETNRLQLSARHRDRFDRSMALARGRLGLTTFTSAWVEGCAMSLEQAIAYALATRGE